MQSNKRTHGSVGLGWILSYGFPSQRLCGACAALTRTGLHCAWTTLSWSAVGGVLAKGCPIRLPIPQSGHWHVAVVPAGGAVQHSVRVLG
ncbi:MAG TPA: DUF1883 domain-containing protein [Chloroflexota bacterium]|nr:DUF1883 domain-containing protein [Chloroflexota bacterium]